MGSDITAPPAGARPNPAQEAALLHAEGREEAALALLAGAVATGAAHSAESWLMLFELLRLRGEAEEFSHLADEYERRFGKPAPSWLGPAARNLPAGLRPGGSGYLQLPGQLDAGIAPLLAAVARAAGEHGAVHLDLGRVRGVQGSGAAMLSDRLHAFEADGVALRLTAWEGLAQRLEQAVAAAGADPLLARLLMDLYRLARRRPAFERVALLCALLEGGAPVAWDEPLLAVFPERPPDEQRREPRYLERPDRVSLRGVIAMPADQQLDVLGRFDGDHPWVNIDLGGLRRIDLACARALQRRVNALAAAGKTVRLLNTPQLVRTLLQTLGLDPAVVVPWPPDPEPQKT